MVCREPGPPPPTPRGRGRKRRRGVSGGGERRKGGSGGTEPPALVPQRPLAKSGTNHSPGAILPAVPPPARGPAPCALRRTRTPTSAPTRAHGEPPWRAGPFVALSGGETFEPSRRDAALPPSEAADKRKERKYIKLSRKTEAKELVDVQIPSFRYPPGKIPPSEWFSQRRGRGKGERQDCARWLPWKPGVGGEAAGQGGACLWAPGTPVARGSVLRQGWS